MIINSAKELKVYKAAYELAMEIFEISKTWPPEERYSLTDQIRRSSRSVCSNIREAWAKRRYEAHFVSKLTDVDGENSETDTWLDFAKDCGYLSAFDHNRLTGECGKVGAMIGSMLNKPEQFLIKSLGKARALIAYYSIYEMGYKGAEVGRALRIAGPSVSQCIERGKILVDTEPEMYQKLIN